MFIELPGGILRRQRKENQFYRIKYCIIMHTFILILRLRRSIKQEVTDCFWCLFLPPVSPSMNSIHRLAALLSAIFILPQIIFSATVSVGSGSYTTTRPGLDAAGRNGVPPGSPQLSGAAVGRPVPTNDWWSKLLIEDHAGNLFNYPFAMGTLSYGLDIGKVTGEPRDPFDTIVVGVSGLAATRATVDDYSDWTVTIGWDSGEHSFRATSGVGMPFVYFSKAATDVASVTVSRGTASIAGEILLITDSDEGSNFAVYAPVGSTWTQSGTTYTSTLNGQNYWSLAMLPAGTPATVAAAWQQYAYVEPINTEVSWSYDENSALLRTEFTTSVFVHEGDGTSVIQGLLPHQWAYLASDAPALSGESLSSVRGELKLLASNTFATERSFHGILPTLPALGAQSSGYDPGKLHQKIVLMENDTLATWTDSYNEGQVMNRLIQTARAAHETGDFEARDKMIATVKERLEDWLTFETGEVAFLFHYSSTWTAMLGYPAGHGQDTNLNDHHFHWGYFIHAAAFMEQFEPGWAEEWGDMVNLLVRDAASPDRSDPLFPFLRNFSPYAGHSWANGFASFPFGNDQESTSESMQFCSSLIHWGAITGDDAIRDLGIYLYTTEQSAIEEYWFDVNERILAPTHPYSLVSRVWGNGYDNGTFWTADIAASYGIELYPIHGGSLYLGHNIAYATKLWAEMAANTGILSHEVNPNLWHDTYWKYLAFTDPAAALSLYNANPDRELKFGMSDAQTYYWLHAMNALGQVDVAVTADDPLAAVFKKEGTRTYVAHNYSDTVKTVSFSDGATLEVPAHSMATSLDLPFAGTIRTPFPSTPAGSSVTLTVEISGDDASLTAVEFFDGTTSLGTLTEAPFVFQTDALNVGRHSFYARLYAGSDFALTGLTQVTAGDILPFSGTPIQIPGTFEPGNYDTFIGGNGQGITYQDSSVGNSGDYRSNEYVDARFNATEGAVVESIGDGEWLDYTVEVASSGVYSLALRYASDNSAGGGPLLLELDGHPVSAELRVSSSGNWAVFRTATFNGIELTAGVHVLRLNFIRGEMNLGRLTFTRTGDLGYEPPVADAGEDIAVRAPESSATLDASGSTTPAGKTLTYFWEQVAGPTVAVLSDPSAASSEVSNLTLDGIYRFRLTVDDGTHADFDELQLVRGELAGLAPVVAILSPFDGDSGFAGQTISVTVSASDPDGTVARVELFNGAVLVGVDTTEPYAFDWIPSVGVHTLRARVTDSDDLETTSAAVTFTADSIAFNGAPAAIPGLIEAEDFDYGGQGLSYYDTTGSNQGGGYRLSETVDIQASTENGFNIGWTQPGEWLNYTVDVATPGEYTIRSRVARGFAGAGAFHVEVDGVDVTGTISVESTGGWQSWVNKTSNVVIPRSGEQLVTIVIEGADVNINYLDFVLVKGYLPPPPMGVFVSGSDLDIFWPASATGFQLVTTTDIGASGDWSAVAQTPVREGDDWIVSVPIAGGPQFFRLAQVAD